MLVDLKSGHCWQLNGVGAEAWKLFQNGASLSNVTDALVSRYDTSRDVVEVDVERVVQELAGQGLLVRNRRVTSDVFDLRPPAHDAELASNERGRTSDAFCRRSRAVRTFFASV